MSSQRSGSMESSQDNIRKRVCKACDRCRLKKSKCDGSSPCSRCKADNAICVFGERKKSQDKVYPKGYVEMLEQQQTQLVSGLRELYTRLQNGQGWPGAPLLESQGGHPLTHDILERLDLLHPSADGNINYDGFEEDCNRMQQRLLERGARYLQRRDSVSSDSDHGHASSPSSYNGTPTTHSAPFSDAFARNNAPPTPPMNSPFPRQSQITSTMKSETPFGAPTYMRTGLDNNLIRSSWPVDPPMMDDSTMDYKYLSNFDPMTFDPNNMVLEPFVINPSSSGPMMTDWDANTDLDFANFINPVNS